MAKKQATSAETGAWTRIDDSVIDRIAEIGPTAFSVYAALAKHTDVKGKCFPSLARLAEIVGRSDRTVRSELRRLEEAGLIRIVPTRNNEGRSLTNVYHLATLPPRGEAEASFRGGRKPVSGVGGNQLPPN